MYTPQEKPAEKETRVRMDTRKNRPESQDLRWLLAEADKVQGRRVELPWYICDGTDQMVLTVECNMQNGQPLWSLFHGSGGENMIWECRDNDFDLMQDVLSMFQTEIEKDFRKSNAPPPAAGAATEATAAEPAPAPSYFADLKPVDYDLLKKQSNVLLGRMLVEAGLISDPMLDEALKLQEMVRNDTLTALQASEALRKAYARTAEPKSTPKTTGEIKKEASIENAAVTDLIKQAGLGTDDKIVIEAASRAWPLVRDSKLKPEQAIIALHYCQRMRVTLADAFSEMGWDAPPGI